MTMEASAALPSGIQRYLLIREATAQKLGPRSQGLITYQVLTTEARRELYLRIAKNEGGGYVSDEAVPVVNLRRCVNEHPAEQPMRASAFKTAFIGRSSNNPTFAAAVMLTEGLLNRDPQRPGVLVDVASWQAWAEAQMAAAAGDLSEVLIGKAPKTGAATHDVAAVGQAASSDDQVADAPAGIDEAVMEDPSMPTDADGPSAPAGKAKRGRGAVLTIFHFASDDDADLAFVARVLEKVNDIREDLGSVGELFDAAFQRRMMELNDDQDVLADLEREIGTRQHATDDARVVTAERGIEERARLERLLTDLDLTPQTLQDTLRMALGLGTAQEPLQGPDATGRMRLRTPLPARWQAVADDSLRLRGDRNVAGAMPWLVFDNRYFIHNVNGRPVFRPSPDTVLMHLGHPVMRQALTSFARLRFPGGQSEFTPPSRWVVTRGPVPAGVDALVLLTVEELGINELRETLHHWVRTVALPVTAGDLGGALPYTGPHAATAPGVEDTASVSRARDLWDDIDTDVKAWLTAFRAQLTATLSAELKAAGDAATAHEKEAFTARIREVAALQKAQSIDKIKREIEERRNQQLQYSLLEDVNERAERELRDLQDELKRRQGQFGDLRERLEEERKRILDHVMPHRFTLLGQAQVFPVSIEIRLPGSAQ